MIDGFSERNIRVMPIATMPWRWDQNYLSGMASFVHLMACAIGLGDREAASVELSIVAIVCGPLSTQVANVEFQSVQSMTVRPGGFIHEGKNHIGEPI